ncbi:MAG: hypothetical protein WC668_03250 [Patescibacteria group bacterium]|jgi:hypothetical protein
MPKLEQPKQEEDFIQGLEYPTENEAGFDGLMSGESPDLNNNEREENERILIEEIKQLISDRKVAQHSGYRFVGGLIKMLNAAPEDRNEKDIVRIEELLNKLKSYFGQGILSHRKIRLQKEGYAVNFPIGGYGPEVQHERGKLGKSMIRAMSIFLDKRVHDGANLDSISYDEMVNSDEFSNILIETIQEDYAQDWLLVTPEIRDERKKETTDKVYQSIKTYFFSSPLAKFAFERLKKENWRSRWEPKNKEDFEIYDDPFRNMADLLFGTNMISTYPPELVKSDYEQTGEMKKYFWDDLSILFKVPNKHHTLGPLENSEGDMGVIGNISPKDFVAVVINKDIEQIPQEILDVIPSNIPIITTDFKVVRMLEKKNLSPKKN